MSSASDRIASFFAAAEERYHTADEWAAFGPARQAIELAKLDDGDLFAQAGIVAQAAQRPIWSVIADWADAGLLGPADARRAV